MRAASGGLTFASCQTPTQTLSYSLSPAGQGEAVRWKSLWIEIGEEINFQLPLQVKQTWFGKSFPHYPASHAQLHSIPDSSTSPPKIEQHRGMGMGVVVNSQQLLSAALSSSHFLPLCSSMGFQWTAVPWANIHLLQCEVFHMLQCGYLFHHGLVYRFREIPVSPRSSPWVSLESLLQHLEHLITFLLP